MSHLWKCIFSPRLFRIYSLAHGHGAQTQADLENGIYSPNCCERWGDNIVKGINVILNIGLYTSPLLITYLYRKEYFCLMGCVHLGKFATGIGILLFVGMFIRGIGRIVNPTYGEFLRTLSEFDSGSSKCDKKLLSKYDFEFWAWPVDFSWNDIEGDESKPLIQIERNMSRSASLFGKLYAMPCDILAWLLVHLFGRHLMYPGSIHLLQGLMGPMLLSGREKLVLEHGGKRNKLLTRDGNEIDTMFVDRRKSAKHRYGTTLVLCCEGNAGFYEIGTLATPLEAGYSVLGWNQPGFSGSTGSPFPSQIQNGVDATIQFAIHKLGFLPEDIIVYSWSIGGYPGTWVAMNYPEIRGLVLDATFDDVLPLAIPHMPAWMSGLVKLGIRNYLNLNNAEQLCRYPGPVTIIRRTRDEIITTREGVLSANRGNDLLVKMLKFRYPNLTNCTMALETLRKWLAEEVRLQEKIYESLKIDGDYCLSQLVSHTTHNKSSFPSTIAEDWSESEKTKMLLYLAQKHLVNFVASHNIPLESRYFKVPWTPMLDGSFVQLE